MDIAAPVARLLFVVELELRRKVMKSATSTPSIVSAARATTGWLTLNPEIVNTPRHAMATRKTTLKATPSRVLDVLTNEIAVATMARAIAIGTRWRVQVVITRACGRAW